MISLAQYNAMLARTQRNPIRDAAPEPVEGTIHADIFEECRRRGWIALHGSMAERTHRTLGEFDFVILADGGRVFLVECKSRTGKLTPAQAAMHHHAEWLGHKPAVVRSLAEFLSVIEPNALSQPLS